jgi:hypothetical protein
VDDPHDLKFQYSESLQGQTADEHLEAGDLRPFIRQALRGVRSHSDRRRLCRRLLQLLRCDETGNRAIFADTGPGGRLRTK